MIMVRPRLPSPLGLPPNARVEAGRVWPAPAGARRIKEFHIYRYDPDTDARPRLDVFEVDLDSCGPLNMAARRLLVAPSSHSCGPHHWPVSLEVDGGN